MNKKRHHTDEGAGANAAPEEQRQENAVAEENNETAREMETLLQERDQAAQERDEYLNLAQRVKADFENYKRRNQCAREDAYADGVRDTLSKFLPVLDNLERAAAAEGSEDALREGVHLVLRQLNTVLSAAGVEEIPAQDCAFDPNVHHAVMQEAVEGCESGRVVTVLQKGYTHGGRVLRHCMVKVSE
jgi:molecular chaperone GrpE